MIGGTLIILCLLFGFIIGFMVGGIIIYVITKDKNDESIRDAFISGCTINNINKAIELIREMQDDKEAAQGLSDEQKNI